MPLQMRGMKRPFAPHMLRLPETCSYRVSALPFPAAVNKAAGAQQPTRSVKAAMSETLMHIDDRCTEGLRSPTCVPGWDVTLHKAFMRTITPDKPPTADMTTLIDECFGQVFRAVKKGASGPEAFTLLLAC